jgi:hypothetical protein
MTTAVGICGWLRNMQMTAAKEVAVVLRMRLVKQHDRTSSLLANLPDFTPRAETYFYSWLN